VRVVDVLVEFLLGVAGVSSGNSCLRVRLVAGSGCEIDKRMNENGIIYLLDWCFRSFFGFWCAFASRSAHVAF
jgi:hypothetical protein